MNLSFIKSVTMVGAIAASSLSLNTMASTINLSTDGTWHQFDIDELTSATYGLEWIDGVVDSANGYAGDGSVLHFNFELTQASYLTVVDAGVAGDVFDVTVNGVTYSSSTPSAPSALNVGNNFDTALSYASQYSRLQILLNPGVYSVTGVLTTSAQDEFGLPLNATVGGIQVSAVPVPAAIWLLGSALTGLAAVSRRKS